MLTRPLPSGGVGQRILTFLSLIRFSHTLFALPWALCGLLLGAGGWPSISTFLWVLGAMVGARTVAMIWNRWVDQDLDATNPRTAQRPSVTGEVSGLGMLSIGTASAALFVLSAYRLNDLCGHLAWPTLAVLLGYSLMKRLTAGSHFVLGIALGLSPLGAYLAARGVFDAGAWVAGLLGIAVLFWTAGFDILYACQDVEHDRREGLYSIPARVGVPRALWWARGCHALVPVALLLAGVLGGLSLLYMGGVAVVVLLLCVEHWLVRDEDLSRINQAFFQVNVVISVVMLLAVALDVVGARG